MLEFSMLLFLVRPINIPFPSFYFVTKWIAVHFYNYKAINKKRFKPQEKYSKKSFRPYEFISKTIATGLKIRPLGCMFNNQPIRIEMHDALNKSVKSQVLHKTIILFLTLS